jgi:hypothetical protein
MKKLLFILVVAMGFSVMANAQNEYVSGTIKHGSQASSVVLALTSNTTFTGNFSNIQFTIQIPNTVSPQPTVTILANPLSTYWSSFTVGAAPDAVVNEGGYYNYTFSKVFVGSPAYTFTAGVEVNTLELLLNNGVVGATTEVRFGHLASGGTSAASAFYVEMGGSDYTNYTSMFYGPGNSNGGMYETYNYVPLANVALPLSITSFDAFRKGTDGVLNWSVENQSSSNSYFAIERSFNGVDFTAIANVPVVYNGNSKGDYTYSDRNITTLKANGVIYYRLKQVDLDGRMVYSNIRNLKIGNASLITVQPNPVINTTQLSFDASAACNVGIVITDAKGAVVATKNYKATAGFNKLPIEMSNYSKGNYILSVCEGSSIRTIQLIKH